MDHGVAWDVQPIVEDIWHEKYRLKDPDGYSQEHTIADSLARVAQGVYAQDPNPNAAEAALQAMQSGYFVPAGRIHAGAGTGRRVTLINCFVCNDIADSMETEGDAVGIMDSLKTAALTMQAGGGIGMDFSTIRPKGARVKRVGSIASGPMAFMDMWDAMCRTIMSAGVRRGAMMGTMSVTHPDIISFVKAKHDPQRLRMFNVSVLVTDHFMEAVRTGADWPLYFSVPPARKDECQGSFIDGQGVGQYIYKIIPANELWDTIISSTYEHAEPGVIFIDRINKMNNLYYCEHLHATNPCGEQPLPEYGDCNLSAINLAAFVENPFSNDAAFRWSEFRKTVKIGVRFLDNVLDVTHYPLEKQREEALAKRRIGLGVTGLANALQQLRIRYGSKGALKFTKLAFQTLRNEAYSASVALARERGPFPLFDANKFLQAEFVKTLTPEIKENISRYGIRNGVLLTVAPTGTTSIYFGNVSSGIEPTFAWSYERRVLDPDGNLIPKDVEDYGYLLYRKHALRGQKPNGEGLPNYMITAHELSVKEHIEMQAAAQKYVDASISKTINCPESMSYEAFKDVYLRAYELGCKGCTTYRPSPGRGAVLSLKKAPCKPAKAQQVRIDKLPRPETLMGTTYKVKWPGRNEANYYITINDYVDDEGVRRPFEIFINTKSVIHAEWITALCRSVSAVFRRGGDVRFIVEELEQVFSPTGGQFVGKRYVPSFVAMVGHTIAKHMRAIGYIEDGEIEHPSAAPEVEEASTPQGGGSGENTQIVLGDHCPKCQQPAFIKKEGCATCQSCGYSDCG